MYVCTGKQMNPEHECSTLNYIFSRCNIKTFNMVQIMEDDSNIDSIRYTGIRSMHCVQDFLPFSFVL